MARRKASNAATVDAPKPIEAPTVDTVETSPVEPTVEPTETAKETDTVDTPVETVENPDPTPKAATEEKPKRSKANKTTDAEDQAAKELQQSQDERAIPGSDIQGRVKSYRSWRIRTKAKNPQSIAECMKADGWLMMPDCNLPFMACLPEGRVICCILAQHHIDLGEPIPTIVTYNPNSGWYTQPAHGLNMDEAIAQYSAYVVDSI